MKLTHYELRRRLENERKEEILQLTQITTDKTDEWYEQVIFVTEWTDVGRDIVGRGYDVYGCAKYKVVQI